LQLHADAADAADADAGFVFVSPRRRIVPAL